MIQRQIENYRRRQAAQTAGQRPAGDDKPAADEKTVTAGVARIVSNDGDGEYTITQQWWDQSASPQAWADAAAPGGIVSAEARDVNLRADGQPGRKVRFRRERNKGGGIETWIDLGRGAETFLAKIDGNAADGTNRWKYAWTEVYKSGAGYGGWATLSGGRSGTTSTDPARNTIEDMNTGADAHIEGNGVDPANLDPAATGGDTFEIMPCTAGNIVRVHEVLQGAGVEYWFSYENGVDGDCGS